MWYNFFVFSNLRLHVYVCLSVTKLSKRPIQKISAPPVLAAGTAVDQNDATIIYIILQ